MKASNPVLTSAQAEALKLSKTKKQRVPHAQSALLRRTRNLCKLKEWDTTELAREAGVTTQHAYKILTCRVKTVRHSTQAKLRAMLRKHEELPTATTGTAAAATSTIVAAPSMTTPEGVRGLDELVSTLKGTVRRLEAEVAAKDQGIRDQALIISRQKDSLEKAASRIALYEDELANKARMIGEAQEAQVATGGNVDYQSKVIALKEQYNAVLRKNEALRKRIKALVPMATAYMEEDI